MECHDFGCGKTLIAKAVANSLAKQVTTRTAQADGTPEAKSFFPQHQGP
jgi:proteasome-associated ATPase